MNIGNILRVADAIEQNGIRHLGFNMAATLAAPGGDYFDHRGDTECGTIACIAGYCVALASNVDDRASVVRLQGNPVGDAGSHYLGIDRETVGQELFFGDDGKLDLFGVTPEHAARCLRNLAITGKVDWEAAMKPADPVMPSLSALAKATPLVAIDEERT